MKWQYQGIGGVPFESRAAARKVRDITHESIKLCQRAIAVHGPVPGYVRQLETLVGTYRLATEFLSQRDRR